MRSRSRGRPVLEVITFLEQDVISHHTLARGERLRIGPNAACQVVVPESLVPRPTTLLSADGETAAVALPPAARAALIDGRGQRRDFDGGKMLTIAPDCDCTIVLGPLCLRVRHIDDAERVPTRGAIAWSTHKGTAVSAVAHMLVFGLVLAVPPDGFALTADSFARNPKLLPFRVRPVTEEVPAWLRRGAAGAAARPTKAPAGRAGDRKSARRNGRLAVKGRSAKTQPLGPLDVTDIGVLGVISRSRTVGALLDPDQNALGADAEQALGNLEGATVGQAYGVNGLDIVGNGGGTRFGTCDGPLEDCASVGTVGTGRSLNTRPGGGARSAGPLLRARHRPRVPSVVAAKATVKGSLSREIIRRVIRRHLNEVRYCYQNALLDSPTLGGRVVVDFVIAGNGSVALSRVSNSTLGHRTAEGCVSGAVRRWQFPAPQGGGIVQVTYPFVFHAVASR